MDDEQHLARRRAELRGSHESLAASSPSQSMDQKKPLTRQQGRAGGFANPDEVEVILEGQDSAWGEETDIISYVQSKVSTCLEFMHLACIQRGVCTGISCRAFYDAHACSFASLTSCFEQGS